MVGGVELHLESNPVPTRDARKAQTTLACTRTQRPHRDRARPAFECLSVSCRGTGQQWSAAGAGALGAADLGMAYALLEEVTINPTQSHQTYPALGKQTLRGHKKDLVCTRTPEKGAVTPRETDPDLPVSVQESLVELYVSSGLLQGRGTGCNSACMGPFEGGRLYLN